jgi:quercetin dioxygenase-like cupin family protein
MSLPTSNIRGFFEILMPGIFLVLNTAFTAYFLAAVFTPGFSPAITSAIQFFTNPLVAIAFLIVVGYPVGMVLRLLKTANIDALSARYIGFLKPKHREQKYLTDKFFYGNWMREKVLARLPAEATRFYDEYWGDKYLDDASQNTSFFNFCKIVIGKFDSLSSNEIYAAEAVGRFLAGSYYALVVSCILMLINAVAAGIYSSVVNVALPVGLAIGYALMLHVIVLNYRLLRCKEVDTVFYACFANREYFEKLMPGHSGRRTQNHLHSPQYEARRDLIERARSDRWIGSNLLQSIDFDKLISLMKSESREHSYLSSLYFAGADVDHPYFLENQQVALGLAVLPEDSAKAAQPKRHPNQTELILSLQGSVCVYYESEGKPIKQVLNETEYVIIQPGVCHWVTGMEEGDAVFLFLKTNPAQEPRGQSCSYPDNGG